MSTIDRKRLVQFRRSYALIIGINAYPDINGNLTTPVPDAQRLASTLVEHQGYVAQDIALYIDPTRAELTTMFERLKAERLLLFPDGSEQDVAGKDSLLFYYAGHGLAGDLDGDGPAGYLLPSDAQPETARLRNASLVPMELAFEAIAAPACHHTLMILDCCFAGSFQRISRSRASLGLGFRPMSQVRFERYKRKRAWQVLASAGSTEEAADWMTDRQEALADQATQATHSPFAQALFDVLSGQASPDFKPAGKNLGDGVLTTNELFLYLHHRVEELTRLHPDFKAQTPDLFPMEQHDGGQFIFCDPRHPQNDPEFDNRSRENPYKGLHLYQPWDREWFFGREQDVAALRQMLDDTPAGLLLVSGASGMGKSSLLRAGVLPHYLEQDYTCYVLRPGSPPWQVQPLPLEVAFSDTGKPILPPPIPWAAAQQLIFSQDKHILFVDQFEEAFSELTKEEQEELHTALFELFQAALRQGSGYLVISMRSDFVWEFETTRLGQLLFPAFAERQVPPDSSSEYLHYRLQNLTGAQQREVLTGPATLQAYEFARRGQESLVDRILQDIEYAPAALPLLSFTMSELYRLTEDDRRERGAEEREFSYEIYEDPARLGGVRGALRGRLQSVYAALPDDAHRQVMQELLLRMVRLNDGEYSRRRIYPGQPPRELTYDKSTKNNQVETVLRALEEAQLLVKGGGRHEPAYLELIHDSLVNTPPTLEWIKTFGRDKLLLQRQLGQAITEYDAKSRQPAVHMDAYSMHTDEAISKTRENTRQQQGLWTNDPKLLQLIQHIVKAAAPDRLLADSEIRESLFQHIPEADRQPLVDFMSNCEATGQLPDMDSFALTGYSTEMLDLFLREGAHWLNAAETAFVRDSWQERVASIVRLKEQRDEAIRLREAAEVAQKQVVTEAVESIWQVCAYLPVSQQAPSLHGFRKQLDGLLSLRKVQRLSPVPVFLSGPHEEELDLQATCFGHYNPDFVVWVRKHALPARTNKVLRRLTQPFYDKLIKPIARAYQRAYRLLENDTRLRELLLTAYESELAKQPSNTDCAKEKDATTISFHQIFSEVTATIPDANQQTSWSDSESYSMAQAAGFWVRRHLDGTAHEFNELLTDLLNVYDEEWMSA